MREVRITVNPKKGLDVWDTETSKWLVDMESANYFDKNGFNLVVDLETGQIINWEYYQKAIKSAIEHSEIAAKRRFPSKVEDYDRIYYGTPQK